jgi:UDP-glucose 4-epimerase
MMINTSFNQTPVLVTGGAGFVGSHLVEQLVASGAKVTIVDNFATGRMEHLQSVLPQIQIIVGDLSDLLRVQKLTIADYRFVFHLAANPYIPPSVENPPFDFHANLENTFALLEALRQMPEPPRLINASSAAVYGNPVRLPIREDDPTVPISPYGVSKLAGERYAAVYSQLYNIPATSMRFFSVYGPRQRKQVVFDLLRKLQANPNRIEVYGDGSQMRDFVYVLDVVQAMMLAAAKAPAEGEAYNVASGVTYSINDLVHTWCEICSLSPVITYTGQVRPGDAEKWEVDMTRLKGLGFEPQYTLKTSLAAIKEWYDACC